MKQLYKPSNLISFLNSLKTEAKKSLSQNFLIDQNIVNIFVKALDIHFKDTVLEIGPGPGVLTEKVLLFTKNVIAIEKDKKFADALKEKEEDILVFEEDFLKFDLSFLKKLNKKTKVIGSIPYNITSPLIIKLLKNHEYFSEIVLMVQKEVANRIISKKRTKDYSSFSIFVNYYSNPEIIKIVSRNSFSPSPNVDSAIIKFTIKENIENINNDYFHDFVKLGFSKRRKKLISNLKDAYNVQKIDSAFKQMKLDENVRAEGLSLEDF